MTGYFAWIIGGALVLLAAAVAARLRTRHRKNARKGQRVSYQMAALSSAAILAVYATGFHRTKEAADAFAARAARRREPGGMAVSMAAPKAVQQAGPAQHIAQAGPTKVAAIPDAAAPKISTHKEDRARVSSVEAQKAASSSAPDAASKSGAVTSPAAATGAASPNPAPAVEAAAVPTPKYKDGTFWGRGNSTHGAIEVSVVIEKGKIVSAEIAKCYTAYSCSWVADMPGLVVEQQNTDIGWVSGATDSSWAFKDAVTAALVTAQGNVRQ